MASKANGPGQVISLPKGGGAIRGIGENLFAVRDGCLFTAPLSAGILHGITRDSMR